MTDPCGLFYLIANPSILALSPMSFILFPRDLRPRSKQLAPAFHSSGQSLWELTWRALCIPVDLFTISTAISARVEGWCMSQHPQRCQHVVRKLVSPGKGQLQEALLFPGFLIFSELSPSLLLLSFPLRATGVDETKGSCMMKEVPHVPNHWHGCLLYPQIK